MRTKPNASRRSSKKSSPNTSRHDRPLRLESLEDRRLLAAVSVDNITDLVNGDTSSIANLIASDGGDGISLREALDAANNTAGADDVSFDGGLSGNTITLGGTQLTISDDVTLTGLGADRLTIDAGGGSGVLSITSGNVTVDGLTITGGSALTGGGIFAAAGTTTSLDALVITGNTATNGAVLAGGGIANLGTMTITDSTISGNMAPVGNAWGGGILNYTGTLTMTNSTISGNTSALAGGGLRNFNGGSYLYHNTFYGNSTGIFGGGISQNSGVVVLGHNLISGKTAANGSDVMRSGGGIVVNDYNLFGDNSIVTGQSLGGFGPGGTDITATNGGSNPTALASILDTSLTDNGGPTPTHALVTGSPAIDSGNTSALTNDQRGVPFIRENGTIDIGAYEVQSLALVVDTLTDESDGDFSALDLSLREALEAANANPEADTVTFDGSLSGTINLDAALGQLLINDDVTVTGPGADTITIDAGGNSRVLQISSGTHDISGLTFSGGSVGSGGGIRNNAAAITTLTDMVITGNTATIQAFEGGGGIRNLGDLTIVGTTLSSNSASQSTGGGLFNQGTVHISDTTVVGNTAVHGGGIHSSEISSSLTVTNSTITNNSVLGNGGGVRVHRDGSASISHSTITDNISTLGSGGGIWTQLITLTLSHNIIAGNFANSTGNEISQNAGTINLNDYNLIGDNSQTNAQALNGGVVVGINDITATSDGTTPTHINSIIHPDLLDLGGPTLTHGLFPVSPALDGGNPAVASPPTYDQRGVGFDRIVDVGAGAIIDIGAYEAQTLPLNGDLNLDGLVDALDFGILAANFGVNGLGYADGNINGDIYVDAADIGLMFAAWTGDTGPGYAQAETSEEVAVANSNSDTLPILLPQFGKAQSERSSTTAIDEQYHLDMLRIDAQQQAGRSQAIVAANTGAKISEAAQADVDQVDASTFDAAMLSLLDEEGW